MKNKAILLTFVILISGKIHSQSDALGHEKWEYALEDVGDVLQLALPLSAGIITLIKKDYQGTKKLGLSYGTTLAITYSLKYLTKKQRPEGRYRFDSFPSGHTSSAFSGASFLQRRYGWDYGIPAYILAGIVGVSRLEGPDDFHDIWDVLGGAIVGIGSTYLFTTPYQQKHMELTFSGNYNSYMLGFTYKF